MYASGAGNTETVKVLIKQGASLDLTNVRTYVTSVCQNPSHTIVTDLYIYVHAFIAGIIIIDLCLLTVTLGCTIVVMTCYVATVSY